MQFVRICAMIILSRLNLWLVFACLCMAPHFGEFLHLRFVTSRSPTITKIWSLPKWCHTAILHSTPGGTNIIVLSWSIKIAACKKSNSCLLMMYLRSPDLYYSLPLVITLCSMMLIGRMWIQCCVLPYWEARLSQATNPILEEEVNYFYVLCTTLFIATTVVCFN